MNRTGLSRVLAVIFVVVAGIASPVAAQSTTTELPDIPSRADSSPPAAEVAAPAPVHHKSPPAPATNGKPATGRDSAVAASTAASLARLSESTQDLLSLLKQQQAVLEDIQYDRRLQNRQISSLEDRLEATLQENAKLQAKVAKLEEQISLGPTTPPATAPVTTTPASPKLSPAAAPAPPPEPATYLPPPDTAGAPGTKSWRRLFTLSGTDGKNSDLFHIEGRQWRVVWHNQDRPGDEYANTSALFISAFPKDDTIPQKVCSKLGSGGDATELDGPGNFYLKIEASGGKWELAVEDFK